jgi:hypothetical protein
MIGTLQDTIGNLIVFIYIGCLIWLWRRPAKGSLMPSPGPTDAGDSEPEESGAPNASSSTR